VVGLLVLSGGLWGISALTSDESAKEKAQESKTPPIQSVNHSETPTQESTVGQPSPAPETKTLTPAPIAVQPPVLETKVVVPEPTVDKSPAPEVKILTNDNNLNLHTSKLEYKNGEAFQLSFTLSYPSYVRVIDRDAKGVVTILRPNPRQTDKLLPANDEQIFPPKGVTIPVSGAGTSTLTLISSPKPFVKNTKLLNDDGGVSEQIKNGSYSWTQLNYELHP
jgi:hypothetical protein